MHLYWNGPRKCFQCVSEEENVVGCPRIDHERSIKCEVLKSRTEKFQAMKEIHIKRRKSAYKCSSNKFKNTFKGT